MVDDSRKMIGNTLKTIVVLAVASLVASPSLADVKVAFIEGAPKDKFLVTNIGACDLPAAKVTIDLSKSASGLVFDVTDTGPGVEVFQPFQIVSGQHLVSRATDVFDGDRSVTLELDSLPMGQAVSFTIDVDDTNGSREITVADDEIVGATVGVITQNGQFTDVFVSNSEAVVRIPGCAA
ncbi:aggregation factor core protein MAFp3, isoform C [Lentibacter algarum]|uniref:aggregation factor core protein MAFp3, isoform C n=1 Tax=Lentibacter algarum TaxID=576131 RepID=UPI001C0757DC|nr:aggregation factor core protein MAFp3, isoform C [Lentibacter algarum]MBU2980453.1 aggregation factor core protein MAFp3, isoform C [Lentibacter algarum]